MKFYQFNESDPLNGFLYQNRDRIYINTTGENNNEARAYSIIDNNKNTFSCLKDMDIDNITNDKQYYEISFRNRVTMTASNRYSYMSYKTNQNTTAYPRSWKIIGYHNDDWITLSTVNETNITVPNVIETYPIDVVLPVTKLRIIQTDEPIKHVSRNYFCVGGFEFFGSFGIYNVGMPTCSYLIHPTFQYFLISLIASRH